MELCYVRCPTVTSIPRNGLLSDKSSFFNLNVNSRKKCHDFRRIKVQFRARPSGATKVKCQAQATTPSSVDSKDGNVVFVAGATGRVGSRTVRELIKLGVSVRAGVRSKKRAETLVQSVKNIKAENVAGGAQPIDKLELVECDLEKPDQIAPALGNSSVVICCIGASEKEIFDVTGPYRIDYQATKNLVDAATSVKVDHFILVTSLGTNKVGFPAAILNLFWGVLCWKRKAEESLLESGLPYTIVRPGGMERPTDSYKETHNLTLSTEDTLFGGQVSTLQVAELMAFMAKNRSLSYCKVVEVVAETTAPLTPMGDLLKKIPSQRKEPIPKKLDIASGSQLVPEKTPAVKEPEQKNQLVPEITSAVKEPEQKKPTVPRPSSPYIAYEDLKPPTSPTPTPSTTPSATNASKPEIAPAATSPISSSVEVKSLETPSIATELKKPNPSSPYINYEDLKPPTSPTPTPSTTPGATQASEPRIIPAATSPVSSTTEVSSSETSNIVTEVKKPYPSSPYINYEDLKPPTSPTPTPSTTPGATKVIETESIPVATSPVSSTTEVNSLETSSIVTEDPVTEVKKPNPSSPYINYEDLKPPSSPTPTPSGSKKDSSVVQPSAEVASALTGGNGDVKSGIVSDSVIVPTESLASPSLAFDDLKPPSSPSPSAPTATLDIETAEKEGSSSTETKTKAQPSSPYTMYEDLKPPTSPVPSVPR